MEIVSPWSDETETPDNDAVNLIDNSSEDIPCAGQLGLGEDPNFILIL